MNVRRLTVPRAVVAAMGLLAAFAPVVLTAQADETDRRRAVGDWLIEDVAEGESRAVHLRRDEGDYSIDYHIWLDPEVSRLDAHGFFIGRLDCLHGGEESVEAPATIEADAVRRQIEAYLAACDTPPAEMASLLQGFEPAFRLAGQWAEERRARIARMRGSRDSALMMALGRDVATGADGDPEAGEADSVEASSGTAATDPVADPH